MTALVQPQTDVVVSPVARTALGRWMSVVAHLDPHYGGVSAAVPALSSSVADLGEASVSLSAFCRSGEEFRPLLSANIPLQYFPAARLKWYRDATIRRQFNKLVDESAGLHIHGLWEVSTDAGARAARAHKKPYVISAHGMLESWALANKGYKKRLYSALFERKNLSGAACLHALTLAEARDYRQFGLRNPIAVIPNGVDVPANVSAEPFLAHFPELRNKKLILFLGRIHFKKGLDLLAQAWSRLAHDWPDAQLVLAGPDFENTQAEVLRLLSTLGVANRSTFTGMLTKELKWSALAAARCFVLPSYSEGLSVSVLEAIGLGLPVVVTEQCNIPEVATHSCGWVIQPQVDQLANSLDSALGASATALAGMRANGRRLVRERYSWPVVGRKMSALYGWLAGGPEPENVEVLESA